MYFFSESWLLNIYHHTPLPPLFSHSSHLPSSPSQYHLFLPWQVSFYLASGNTGGAFEILTTNDSVGEVFVARPLDREELEHYILKVSRPCPSNLGCSRTLRALTQWSKAYYLREF